MLVPSYSAVPLSARVIKTRTGNTHTTSMVGASRHHVSANINAESR